MKHLVLRKHATAPFSSAMIISMEKSGVSEVPHFTRIPKVCGLSQRWKVDSIILKHKSKIDQLHWLEEGWA